MNREDRHRLDDYFAKARTEPPATSEEEILSLLDGGMSGRQSHRIEHELNNRHNRNRGRTMKIIAFSLIAASLGSAAVYFNTQQNQKAMLPATQAASHKAEATASQEVHQADASYQSHQSYQAAPQQAAQRTERTPTTQRTPPAQRTIPAQHTTAPQQAPDNQPVQTADNNRKELDSALAQELGRTLSTLAADYWAEKINNYRTRIDRMLTPDDLAELNTLRVRWSIVMAEDDDDDELEASVRIGDREATTQSAGKKKSNSLDFSMGMRSNGDGDSEVSTSTKVNGVDMDQKAAMAMVMAMMVAKGDERAIIVKSVKEMAEGYRPQLDGLKETIFSDVAGFVTTVAERVDRFVADNRDQFPSANADSLTVKLDAARKAFSSDEMQNAIGMIYDFLGEPVLMLYNGAGIDGLIPASIAAPVPGMKMTESNALRQSTPNPASTQATISYMLNEPSSATTLRLFDAGGKAVATHDQGAQPAGEHTATLDVSGLAPGTYLYHLTVQTSKGERVFSKTLQVAR